RAVSIVNEANATGRRPQFHAGCGRRIAFKPCGYFTQLHTKEVRRGSSKVKIGDDLRRTRGNMDGARFSAAGADLKKLAFFGERDRGHRQHLVTAANVMQRAAQLTGKRHDGGLVRWQQQPAVTGEIAKERHFFFGNGFAASERGKVRQPNVGENAVIRRSNLFERGHVSGLRDAHLKNGQRLRLFRRKDGQRQAELAVVTAGRSQKIASRKQGAQSVFDNRLAVAAGDGQNFLEVFAAVPLCQRLQCAQRVRNHDQRPRRIKFRAAYLLFSNQIFSNQSRGSAVAECVGEKAMSVSVLALQGNKQRAGNSAARIRGNAINGDLGSGCRPQFSFGCAGNAFKMACDQEWSTPGKPQFKARRQLQGPMNLIAPACEGP